MHLIVINDFEFSRKRVNFKLIMLYPAYTTVLDSIRGASIAAAFFLQKVIINRPFYFNFSQINPHEGPNSITAVYSITAAFFDNRKRPLWNQGLYLMSTHYNFLKHFSKKK